MVGHGPSRSGGRRPSWREAWLASPGPRGMGQAFRLAAKGFCMGCADIIPGVSGGTIAFITGIYEDLLAAIKSFDAAMLGRLARGDARGALAGAHLRFLVPLLCGIGCALLAMARVVHWLLTDHPVLVWSLFFGLIAASIWVVGRRVERWSAGTVCCLLCGAALGWLVVGLIPVRTPDAPWFVFCSGAVAICAMLLPGVSGAFLLLVLGKYEYVTATLKHPLAPGNLAVMAVFAAGCVAGVLGFSRLLHWLMTRHHALTVAGLTGLMAGAMRKVWPWKDVLETAVVGKKVVVLREALAWPGLDASLAPALALMLAGALAVLLLDRLAEDRPEG